MTRTTVPPTPAIERVPQNTRRDRHELTLQLNHLASLSGLTGCERELTARLRAIPPQAISVRSSAVFRALWQRHGEGYPYAR